MKMRTDNIPSVLIDYLTPHQLKIYLHIKSYSNNGKRYASFSQTDYCKNHSMGKSTVSDAMKFLIEEEIIFVAKPAAKFNKGGKWEYLSPQYGLSDYTCATGLEEYCREELDAEDSVGIRKMVLILKNRLNKYSRKK